MPKAKKIIDITVADVHEMFPYASEPDLINFLKDVKDNLLYWYNGNKDISELTFNDVFYNPPKRENQPDVFPRRTRGAVTVDQLVEKYPTVNTAVLERHATDLWETFNEEDQLRNVPGGLEMNYPQGLLSDEFSVLIANAEFYQSGRAQAMQEDFIESLTRDNHDGRYDQTIIKEKMDLAIIKQMPEFYRKAVNDYIDNFKTENSVFKDAQIPYNQVKGESITNDIWGGSWDKITVSNLKELYPTTNDKILEEFLKDVQFRAEDSLATNIARFGLHARFPSEFLASNNHMAVAASAVYYQDGYAEALHAEAIEYGGFQYDWDPEDFEKYNLMSPEEKQEIRQESEARLERLKEDFEIIKQMPDFCAEVMKESIAAFKNAYPAFKDVQIPYNQPPMPDYFDVMRNGKTILCKCLHNQDVQATQFCLMKDPTDAQNPYFVLAFRVDKLDDDKEYKVQNLNTRNLAEAQKMFADVIAGQPTNGLSLKEQIQQITAEKRDYLRTYDKRFEQWSNIKEEWLSLASEEQSLRGSATMTMEAATKHLNSQVNAALKQQIQSLRETVPARDIYAALQPALDDDGYFLASAGKAITGIDVYGEYPIEDNLHQFEYMNGFGELRYLEAAKFGQRVFDIVATGAETMSKYSIDAKSESYLEYQERLFNKAVDKMQSSAHLIGDIKSRLMGLANLQKVGSIPLATSALPKEGWITADEHFTTYSQPYVDEEERYAQRYKQPPASDYCMYGNFEPFAVFTVRPAMPLNTDYEPKGIVNKVLDFLMPGRVTERLQQELHIISKQMGIVKENFALMDTTIPRMESEISQMKEFAVQAKQEIRAGKHFNDWVKMNLKSEMSAFGLDPDNAAAKDLFDAVSRHTQPQPLGAEQSMAMVQG